MSLDSRGLNRRVERPGLPAMQYVLVAGAIGSLPDRPQVGFTASADCRPGHAGPGAGA
jgi:hypothetical protein